MHLTLQDVRNAFVNGGISVSDWADAHGFRRENVYALLSGRTRGRRGQAHEIAAALGLKQKVDSMIVLCKTQATCNPPLTPTAKDSSMS